MIDYLSNLGWKRDTVDSRDHKYKISLVDLTTLPDKVDLRKYCSPVEYQRTLGSCTAQSIAGVLEFLDIKKKLTEEVNWIVRLWKQILRFFNKLSFDVVSRLFVYYNEREVEGSISEDAGAMLRTGIKVCNQYGWCHEKLWPYNIEKFKEKPTENCYNSALPKQIKEYQRLTTEDERLACLAEGYPFIFGIDIFSSFITHDVEDNGIIPMPDINTERWLGGHALCAVGYNKITRNYIVRNSWGDWWGQKGYCLIPFDYLTKYGDDMWTIRK